MAARANTKSPNGPAKSKADLVTRWERKATDLERAADRVDDRGDDGTDLRLISDILKSCAIDLDQAKF